MLYSLPSRELIADSVEYTVNGHRADALVYLSNCDKITPGMLNAAMRRDIPTVFVSGRTDGGGQGRGGRRCGHAPTYLVTTIAASANSRGDEEGLAERRAKTESSEPPGDRAPGTGR